MRIGKRSLTDTKTSRQMTFDKEYLDEFGFTAGAYTILYEPNRISIVKEVKEVVLSCEDYEKQN